MTFSLFSMSSTEGAGVEGHSSLGASLIFASSSTTWKHGMTLVCATLVKRNFLISFMVINQLLEISNHWHYSNRINHLKEKNVHLKGEKKVHLKGEKVQLKREKKVHQREKSPSQKREKSSAQKREKRSAQKKKNIQLKGEKSSAQRRKKFTSNESPPGFSRDSPLPSEATADCFSTSGILRRWN